LKTKVNKITSLVVFFSDHTQNIASDDNT